MRDFQIMSYFLGIHSLFDLLELIAIRLVTECEQHLRAKDGANIKLPKVTRLQNQSLQKMYT